MRLKDVKAAHDILSIAIQAHSVGKKTGQKKLPGFPCGHLFVQHSRSVDKKLQLAKEAGSIAAAG